MKKLSFYAMSVLLAACTAGNPTVSGKNPPSVEPHFPVPPKPAQSAPPVFQDVQPGDKLGRWKEFSNDFAFFPSEATEEQSKYNENTMSVFFQVEKGGFSVNDLKSEQFRIKENGIDVGQIVLGSDRKQFNQVAEIIFVVDITGTMVELIETAKKRLKEFIRTSRQRGFHTRMCFSTFGDYTVKKCTRFYDNNPNDKKTETQVRELLNELSKIQAYRGQGRDPGYPDLDENPMRALIDATQAPWLPSDSQRFVILVTDWGFLHSPGNQGTVGDNAPTMQQVYDSLRSSQVKVFAVTRNQATHRDGKTYTWSGYNTPFQGQQEYPGIVQASGGEHFDFDQVMRKRITLDDIFERILLRVSTTYKATYVVDKVQGLDPSLPIEQRQVEVELVNPELGTAKRTGLLSSMPKGRPQYKQTWLVSDHAIHPGTMKVYVDGQELSSSEFTVNGGEVTFTSAPKPGAKMRFVFYYEAFEKNLRLAPMTLPAGFYPDNTDVMLNGIRARIGQDVVLTKDSDGATSLTINDSVLAPEDPFAVRANERLQVKAMLTK